MRQVVDLENELREAGILDGFLVQDHSETIAKALQLVAEAHGTTVKVLRADNRSKHASRARRDAYAALRNLGLSYPEIGEALNKSHGTVIQGIKKRNAEVAAGRMLTWKEIRT